MKQHRVTTVTIANGASLSGILETRGYTLAAILMPAAWTAANLTFQGAARETDTFLDVYDAAAGEVTVQAAAARVLLLSTDAAIRLLALPFLKIRSGTTGTPVAQGAERILTVVLKEG